MRDKPSSEVEICSDRHFISIYVRPPREGSSIVTSDVFKIFHECWYTVPRNAVFINAECIHWLSWLWWNNDIQTCHFNYKIFVRLLLRYTVHSSCLCGITIQISSALSWFITSDSVSGNFISWAPMIPVGNMSQKWQNAAFGVSYLQMKNAWNIMRSPIPEIAEWNYIYLWRYIQLYWREVGSFRIETKMTFYMPAVIINQIGI